MYNAKRNKFIKLNNVIFLFLLFFSLIIMLAGCEGENIDNIVISDEQQEAYNIVFAYSEGCSDGNDKKSLLLEIKKDISKVSSENKLNIEVEIGKLKIDKLKLKEKKYIDIQQQEQKANYDKSFFGAKMNSITNIYPFNYSSYQSEISLYESKISQLYTDYNAECRRINSSSMGQGFKKLYLDNANQKFMEEYSSYNSQLSKIKQQWQNKLEYDKYNNLYNSVDDDLQKVLSEINQEFNKKSKEIDNNILQLTRKR